jgi:hypothetical protein
MSTLIVKRLANALFAQVELEPATASVLRWETLGLSDSMFKRLGELQGGLWVGGTLFAYDDHVAFSPNALNAALQSGDMTFDLPWSAIDAVTWRFGILTGIIEFSHSGIKQAIRCFGAKKLSLRLDEIRKSSAAPPQAKSRTSA